MASCSKVILIAVMCSLACLHCVASGNNHSLLRHVREDELPAMKCLPWHYYNSTTNECECYKHIVCKGKEAFTHDGHCVTYDDGSKTLSYVICPFLHVFKDGLIKLPHNVSELNFYMCGLHNRTGRVCSECVEGFGPSLSSIGYECSNCSGTWRGWSLYFLLEFGPTTIFYLTILVLQISLTSAPVTGFIMYSQIVLFEMMISDDSEMRGLLSKGGLYLKVTQWIATFFGIFNLDFLWYIVPPFCVSDSLKLIDLLFIRQICVLYPFFLILVTWICIELHSHNFRPFVWLWSPLHKYVVCLRKRLNLDSKNDLVNVFSSLFLLSCSKFVYAATILVTCHHISVTNTSVNKIESVISVTEDLSVGCYSTKHILYSTVSLSMTFVFVLLPVLILTLYPTKIYKACLSNCKIGGRSQTALFTFVEKFHCCYKDGLNGGKDMRSFSGVHFLVRFFCFVGWRVFLILKISNHGSFYKITGLAIVTVFMAYLKPHKKSYMNIMEVLLLAYTTFFYFIHLELFDHIITMATVIVVSLPALIFLAVISMRLISVILKRVLVMYKSTKLRRTTTTSDPLVTASTHFYGSC